LFSLNSLIQNRGFEGEFGRSAATLPGGRLRFLLVSGVDLMLIRLFPFLARSFKYNRKIRLMQLSKWKNPSSLPVTNPRLLPSETACLSAASGLPSDFAIAVSLRINAFVESLARRHQITPCYKGIPYVSRSCVQRNVCNRRAIESVGHRSLPKFLGCPAISRRSSLETVDRLKYLDDFSKRSFYAS